MSSCFEEVKLKIKVNNGYLDEYCPQVPKVTNQHHQVPQVTNQLRICDVCGKKFSCGKALGGHKRIHQQQLNDNKDVPSVKSQNHKIKTKPAIGVDDSYICYVCGKPFPSSKSLFGHMRCHPERNHRGMHPPSELEKLSSLSSTVSESESRASDDDDDDDQMFHSLAADTNFVGFNFIDLSESLAGSGWSSTAKRGRKAILSTSSSYVDEQIPYEAIQTLMLLGRDQQRAPVYDEAKNTKYLAKKRKDHVLSAGKERRHQVKKLRIDHAIRAKAGGESKNELLYEIIKGAELKDANIFGSPLTNLPLMKRKTKLLKERKIVEPPMMIAEDERTSPEVYKCNTCEKTFPTHQALGGHRSSHIKSKNLVKVEDESAFEEEENCLHHLFGARDEEDEENEVITKVSSSPQQHQGKICSKIFPAGQALGGHRRRNCISQAASPEKMIARDIDLNVLPDTEEEVVSYPQLQQLEGEIITLC